MMNLKSLVLQILHLLLVTWVILLKIILMMVKVGIEDDYFVIQKDLGTAGALYYSYN